MLQWHLQDGCNLACRHCYREARVRPALDPEARREVLARLGVFLDRLGRPGRLHLAGGEPAACPQLPELVERAAGMGLGSRLLSNGTLVTPDLARRLRAARCVGVQVSVEGPRELHEHIRGPGTFPQAMRGVAMLREAGLPVTLAMTLHAENRDALEPVAALARTLADRVYFSRFIPLGQGQDLGPGLSAAAWGQAQGRILALHRHGQTIALRDPTFRPAFAAPWHARRAPVVAGCAAGWACLTVESDGTLYPCRRLPIPLGHVLEVDLVELFHEHPVLRALRDRDRLGGACGRCPYRWVCGGCRAAAFATSGDPLAQDPGCPWRTLRRRLANGLEHARREALGRLFPRTLP